MDAVSITHYNTMTRWTIPVCLVTCATAVLAIFQSCLVLRRQEHKRLTRPRYALLRGGSRTHASPSQCHSHDVIQPDPCVPQSGGRTVLWVVSRLYVWISY